MRSLSTYFTGAYPWPDHQLLSSARTSNDAMLREEAELVDRLIGGIDDWLYAMPSKSKWTEAKRLELQSIATKLAGPISATELDRLSDYATWYGWHEGILDFDKGHLK